MEEYHSWVKVQAAKDLISFKDFISVIDIEKLRERISALNYQQRRLFDDFIEKMISTDLDETPCYLFISGEAGTGKSYLVKVLIEAIKLINVKPGDEVQKPPLLVMAPTANAAFLIGGKTIDSVFGFSPADKTTYTSAEPSRMATMKYQYEDVKVLVCDEISMVGSMKLAKINYRLQDLANANKKHEFMGGISFIASGNNFNIYMIVISNS